MTFYRPKSLLRLTLVGFSLVSLPLILALVTALVYVDRLAGQSQRAVYQAVQAIRNSQVVGEQVRTMERSARQYLVLGDSSFLDNFLDAHAQFRQTVLRLDELPLEDSQRNQLQNLVEVERRIHETLRSNPPDAGISAAVVQDFALLNEQARAILAESNRLIDREVDAMQSSALRAQQVLVWQALALIPGTLIFVGLFTVLITRPIRQIDKAIHQLGDGRFADEIDISGPEDLRSVGKRLDWLRRRLLDLEEEKNKFLRHVSHELKTPLTALREGTDLLAEEVVGPLNGEQREVAGILQQNCLYLQKLIEDLLNFSVAQARSATLELRPVHLKALITAVAETHRLAAKAKQLQLGLELDDISLVGDQDKLRTVVDNLVSNAVKYCPPRGRVEIYLRAELGFAIIDVIDTGPGIAATDKDKLFDAFYQGQAVAEGPVQGTGIGLSIAKEFVLAHHGRIEIIESTPVGAHFRVTLPLHQEPVEKETL